MEPGIYYGVRSTSAIPKNALHTELSHTEKHAGKDVNYYHVWVPRPDRIDAVFKDGEQPQRKKISIFDMLFRNKED